MADRGDEQKAAELAEASRFPLDYDASAETRVRRKLDSHMLPLFFVLCELPTSPSAPFFHLAFSSSAALRFECSWEVRS